MSHFLLLLIALILFPFLSTSSQNTGKITVGSSITATKNSETWLSTSGDFAFGFQPLPNDTNRFVLAVWFAKIPSKTIVWFDRHLAPLGSILTLESANGLVLRDTNDNVLLYNYTGGFTGQVAYAFVNDTGNFVLYGSHSNLLWQSFQNPSDTILPTQTMELNGRQLISKNREADFSYGRFYGGMSKDGNFVLNTKSVFSNLDFDDEYYNNQTTSGYILVFDQNQGKVTIVDKNGQPIQSILSSTLSSLEYYFRATLEFDGVFSLYSHPKKADSNSKWVAAGTLPGNICMEINGQKGSGACGFNNVCSLDDSTLRPICKCPDGFLLVDPSNSYGDCKSNFTENCVDQGGKGNEYGLVVVQDVDWPFNDYEQRNKSSLDECKSACYDDYFCGAAIFRSDSCWKKRLPLSNGRVDKSLKATAFLKVRIS